MNRTVLFLCIALVTEAALAQAPACSTFEGSADGWTVANAFAAPATAGSRKFLDVRDGGGPSNLVAPASYGGHWLRRTYGCGTICFDVNFADDGFPGSAPVRPYFVIADAAGHSATFQAKNEMVEGSGWRTICAPIVPAPNAAGDDGAWRLGPNTTPADWLALIDGVQSLRIAIDVHPSLSERLQFDNICFRPRICVGQPSGGTPVDQLQAAPNVTNWAGCPERCLTVERREGETYQRCEFVRTSPPGKSLGLMAYVPGTRNLTTCDPGTPIDLQGRHRLFVHGLHADGSTWDFWVQRVKPIMDPGGFRTVADNTGATTAFGPGTAPLLEQVSQLAAQINAGFPNVPDASVYVYAHSLGSLKMEALLQLGYAAGVKCGFGSGCSDPLYRAAMKIRDVTVFQGAHGGCSATTANGDRPNHSGAACPASIDIGKVNDSRIVSLLRFIPGTQTRWNMRQVLWQGRAGQEKRFTYVVATYGDKPVCKGELGLICEDERSHDGAVYAEQMVPTFYDDYADALQAGLVTVVNESPYCHLDEDRHEPPRLSTRIREKYVGRLEGAYDYFVGKMQTITVARDIATCDQRCFCGANRPAACAEKVDCTRFETPPFASCVNPGTPVTGGGMTNEGLAFAPKANEQIGSWKRCASEGGTCTFAGTRLVRYGANGRYAMLTATGSTACTNAVFGDPTPFVPKTCDVLADAPPQLSTSVSLAK